jgi:hypothetical protein
MWQMLWMYQQDGVQRQQFSDAKAHKECTLALGLGTTDGVQLR